MVNSNEKRNKAFAEIYEKYKDSVFRTCYLFLRDYYLAQDATQETFFKVYCKLQTFKGKSDIKTWITKIALNICKDRLKKKSSGDIPKEEIHIENFSFNSGEIENRLTVVGAIGKLPLELREVIILYYYQELKQKEISKILKIPQTTVTYRLKKAKETLKKYIGEEFFYE